MDYYRNPNYKELLEKKASFSKAERFKQDPFREYDQTPGPGEYTIAETTSTLVVKPPSRNFLGRRPGGYGSSVRASSLDVSETF